jgi:hypothetical protein
VKLAFMVNSLDFPSLKRKLKIMKIAPFLSFTPMCVDQLNLVPTVDGKNYFVTFIDTHYTVVYLITYKSDVFPMFKDFVAKCEAHFNLKIVNLYCDIYRMNIKIFVAKGALHII